MLDMAKLAVKRTKTLRHPSILSYVDSLETDKFIYLVVEPVEPLEVHLSKTTSTSEQKQFAISWGLHQIATGISFLNKDCQLCHHNICLGSIFVDRAGEWRLFGLEYVTPAAEPPPIKVLPSLKNYNPPECEAPTKQDCPPWASDSWGLGCLIWESFNGRLQKTSLLKAPGKIPSSLTPFYCELVCANPKSRPNALTFLKKASKGKGFFKNKFVETMLFLSEIHIKDNEEKINFFNKLSSSLDAFPQDVCLYKILPELINAFEYGNAGSSVLSPLFKLGKLLSEEDYQKKVVPCVVKMFSSKDRATRVKLLQQVEQFIDHIQPSVVNSQIFPNVAQGFLDTNPTIRDHTIKCMVYLAPKLNYQNLNEEMLKHFARLQSKDDQGGIRTNTTVCLGKIASYLHPQTRKKVLISAFLRALRDSFPPARAAAILALSATEHYYSVNDCATKVLPALCHFTVDPEKSIRDQTFKAIGGFLSKLEKVSEDPTLLEKLEKELETTGPASIAASWTSWAVTSLTDKLYNRSRTKSPSPSSNQSPTAISPTLSDAAKNAEKDVKEENSPVSNTDSWSNDWDEENCLEETEMNSSSADFDEQKEDTNDWEDAWESFETDKAFAKNTEKLKSFFPTEDEDPFQPSEKKLEVQKEVVKDWDSLESWETWEDPKEESTSSKIESHRQRQEQNRLAREEKRRQRQKEQQQARPRKLGAQKIS
ncbi:N-terminal kinase-like protein [Uloborus diversus]|uniref:N-terminal kinase-like protein n=1 Tax=Uloborus diversus TaxID=327109 RepID=UPI002409DD2D|nr:N-terminal kinase-like protein [Uloborus diversus]